MTLYNLRSATDGFRITKFDADMNPESSYVMGHGSAGGLPECTCPAGTRPSCRHRQMFSSILPLVDTAFFWDFDHSMIVDSDGDQVTYLELEEALATMPDGVEVVSLDEPATLHNAIAEAVGEPEAISAIAVAQPQSTVTRVFKQSGNWRRI